MNIHLFHLKNFLHIGIKFKPYALFHFTPSRVSSKIIPFSNNSLRISSARLKFFSFLAAWRSSISFSISSEPKGCDLLIDSVSSAYDIPDNAHLLMTEEICLAVSSSHPLAHTGHISVEQMMDEKFIDLADTPSYAGVFNSIFSKCKKTPQIAYSCNDYILQGKLISLGLGVSFVASVTWTSSSLPENISLLHIDDCPHFRSIYYQPLGSFCSENQRIFEHQLEEYFKNLNN